MKTRCKTSWVGFLSTLRTKEAHKTCQFRANSYKEEKIKFWKDLMNIEEKIFLHSKPYLFSFFLLQSLAL